MNSIGAVGVATDLSRCQGGREKSGEDEEPKLRRFFCRCRLGADQFFPYGSPDVQGRMKPLPAPSHFLACLTHCFGALP